ncbi:TPA: hypothetical protein QDC55_005224 [Burkholderia cenocepacia]|nr:hypothetical protein [Burkholderia cenocepacia]HDR9814354.1 hypothetical protein [Burkholderia cenocepacia]HDR9820747.1 hypothetical protein [Burkholderia cenocepacia]HDR9831627.1 hypothetical protein [Burkholderia cenocepacia]
MPFDPHVPFAASSSMTAFGRRNPRGAAIADRAAQIGAVRERHPLDVVWRLKTPQNTAPNSGETAIARDVRPC